MAEKTEAQIRAEQDAAYAELERQEKADAAKKATAKDGGMKKADAEQEDPAAARPGHTAEAPKERPEPGSGGTPLDAAARDNPMPPAGEDGQEKAKQAAIAAGVDPKIAHSATVPGSNL